MIAFTLFTPCACKKSEPKKSALSGNVLAPASSKPASAAETAGSSGETAALPSGLAEPKPTEEVEEKPAQNKTEVATAEKTTVTGKDEAYIIAEREAAKQPKATATESAENVETKSAATKVETPSTPNTHVTIPKTDHVSIEVPTGLKELLDDDPRMQPWVNKAVGVADKCYARQRSSNPFAKGTIAVKVTMHKNARPSGVLKSLPPMLAMMMPCATEAMGSSHMPLFTGPEGRQYTVKIHFTK